MTEILKERLCAEVPGDIVVFAIGSTARAGVQCASHASASAAVRIGPVTW